MLQGRPEREVAFAAAKQLAYMRPEHYLKIALPNNTEIKTAFLSAMLLVQPQLPVKPDQMSMIQQYLPVLRSKIQPQWGTKTTNPYLGPWWNRLARGYNRA